MATYEYTKPTPEQMEVAFGEIASMALALRELCYSIVDGGTDNKGTAAATIASQIGWIADRCIGFDHHDSEFWMLPPIWKCDESEAMPMKGKHFTPRQREYALAV